MNRQWPRLLLVDDDSDSVFILQQVLSYVFADAIHPGSDSFGFNGEIVSANDGNTALRILKEEGPFDAVLTDLMMGWPDGFELLKRIRQGDTENPDYGTPRNVLVGAVSAGCQEFDCFGFDFAIDKPTQFANLIVLILAGLVPADPEGRIRTMLSPLEPVIIPHLKGTYRGIRLTLSGASFRRNNETGEIVHGKGFEATLAEGILPLNPKELKNKYECGSAEANQKRHRVSGSYFSKDVPGFTFDIELPAQECVACKKIDALTIKTIRQRVELAIGNALKLGKVEAMDAGLFKAGFVASRDARSRSIFLK